MESKREFLAAKSGMRNIFLLGLTSFFTDLSTEMVAPIVTIYLSGFATVAIIGLIEGITESMTALLKSYSGYIGDKFSNKKMLAFVGYAAAILYKIMLIFSFTWVGVLFAKIIDRTGKGLRTAPRDALVAESGGKKLGSAFGFHKMMDMAGSAMGILMSILLVIWLVGENANALTTSDFHAIFLISIVPVLFGLVSLLLVTEAKHHKNELKKFSLKGIHLPKQLIWYLVVVLVFSIGNSSNAFLVLRIKEVGLTTLDVLKLYLVYNLSSSIVSFPLGKLSDKIGRKHLVIPAYILYGLVYLGFAFLTTEIWLYLLFVVYGIFQAILAGSEKSFVTELAPKDLKGTVLGLYGTAQGLGLLAASLLAGWIWTAISPSATFVFGGVMGFLAAISLAIVFQIRPEPAEKLQ